MTIEVWLAFVATSAIMLVIPGPTILTVVAYATSHGKKATLTLVAAVSLGDLSVIALSVVGLGGLLALSSTAFTVVKIAGGLYLLFLGLRMIWAAYKRAPRKQSSEVSLNKKASLFFNTWLVTALNPKGILFFGAFLPQFIQTNQAIEPQLAILTITFVCLAAINTFTYAMLASQASGRIRSESTKKRFEVSGGVAMSVAGLWALTAKPAS